MQRCVQPQVFPPPGQLLQDAPMAPSEPAGEGQEACSSHLSLAAAARSIVAGVPPGPISRIADDRAPGTALPQTLQPFKLSSGRRNFKAEEKHQF